VRRAQGSQDVVRSPRDKALAPSNKPVDASTLMESPNGVRILSPAPTSQPDQCRNPAERRDACATSEKAASEIHPTRVQRPDDLTSAVA
jgi:hypothetical protein